MGNLGCFSICQSFVGIFQGLLSISLCLICFLLALLTSCFILSIFSLLFSLDLLLLSHGNIDLLLGSRSFLLLFDFLSNLSFLILLSIILFRSFNDLSESLGIFLRELVSGASHYIKGLLCFSLLGLLHSDSLRLGEDFFKPCLILLDQLLE